MLPCLLISKYSLMWWSKPGYPGEHHLDFVCRLGAPFPCQGCMSPWAITMISPWWLVFSLYPASVVFFLVHQRTICGRIVENEVITPQNWYVLTKLSDEPQKSLICAKKKTTSIFFHSILENNIHNQYINLPSKNDIYPHLLPIMSNFGKNRFGPVWYTIYHQLPVVKGVS